MRDYLKLLEEHRQNPTQHLPPKAATFTLFAPEEVSVPQLNTKCPNRVGPLNPDAPRALQQQQFFNDINDGYIKEPEKYAVRRGLPFLHEFEALLARPPEGLLNQRWVQAIVDAEDFLKTWGAQAEALGWTADDLFALDPIAPLRRHDIMGLVWSLQGCPVVALTEQCAVIRCVNPDTKRPTGSELRFYRKGIDLPWAKARS